MKKLILLLLIFPSICFAQDTNIGKFNLTQNQRANLAAMDVSPFKGVSVWEDGTVIAVSEFDPNQFQINALVSAINNSPDTPSQQVLIDHFSVDKLIEDLNAALSGDSVLFQYYAVVKDWASAKKFSQIKNFLASLVSGGVITQDLSDSINNIFKNQGIDLNVF